MDGLFLKSLLDLIQRGIAIYVIDDKNVLIGMSVLCLFSILPEILKLVATCLQCDPVSPWADIIGELARAITCVLASGGSVFSWILGGIQLVCAYRIGIRSETNSQSKSCNVALVKVGASVAHAILLAPEIFLVPVDNSPFHKKPFETFLGIVMWLTTETKPNIATAPGWRDDLWFLLARAAMPALLDPTESNEETGCNLSGIWGCIKAAVNIVYICVVCVLGIIYCTLETTSTENKLWMFSYVGLTFFLFGGSVVAMIVANQYLDRIRNSPGRYTPVSSQEMIDQRV